MDCVVKMKVKKVHHTLLIIVIIIVILLSLYFYIPKGTGGLSVLGSIGEINTEIFKTTTNQIAETDETITYRFRWFSKEDFTYNAKNLNLEFTIGDYQDSRNKPRLPNDVPNQFDVEGEVVLTGIAQKNLIAKKEVICHLIEEEGKPRMTCKVNVLLKSDVLVDYTKNIDGYADIIFRKVVV